MAAESGIDTVDLIDRLFEEPRRFDFIQAVRILRAADRQGRRDLLTDDPRDSFVRFASNGSFSFPASDIAEILPADESNPVPRVEVTFMGIAAPHAIGSLPTPYLSEINDQPRNEDSPLKDFIEIFDHRLIALYAAATTRLDPLLEMESGEDLYERAFAAIAGIGTQGLRERTTIDDRALFARAGLIAMNPMPATALTGILESYFEVPFRMEQFLPAWFDMLEEDQTSLGVRNCTLGGEAVLGDSIELCQSRFRLEIGPLSWKEYRAFFADGASFRALVDFLEASAPADQNYEVQLVLAGDEVPALQLSHRPSDANRLGWSTWLASSRDHGDRHDAVLTQASLSGHTPA